MPVYTITDEQFEDGVANAAQRVAQVHRRRLVKHAAVAGVMAGFLSAGIVSLAVVFFTAKANCNAITSLAQATEHRFVETKASSKTFRTLSKDRLGLTETQFEALTRKDEEAQQREIVAVRRVAHRDCTLI